MARVVRFKKFRWVCQGWRGSTSCQCSLPFTKHMKNSFMIEMPNRKLFKKNHFDKRCWKITHIKGSLAKNWLISVWMHQITKQSFSCFQYVKMKIITFNHLILFSHMDSFLRSGRSWRHYLDPSSSENKKKYKINS